MAVRREVVSLSQLLRRKDNHNATSRRGAGRIPPLPLQSMTRRTSVGAGPKRADRSQTNAGQPNGRYQPLTFVQRRSRVPTAQSEAQASSQGSCTEWPLSQEVYDGGGEEQSVVTSLSQSSLSQSQNLLASSQDDQRIQPWQAQEYSLQSPGPSSYREMLRATEKQVPQISQDLVEVLKKHNQELEQRDIKNFERQLTLQRDQEQRAKERFDQQQQQSMQRVTEILERLQQYHVEQEQQQNDQLEKLRSEQEQRQKNLLENLQQQQQQQLQTEKEQLQQQLQRHVEHLETVEQRQEHRDTGMSEKLQEQEQALVAHVTRSIEKSIEKIIVRLADSTKRQGQENTALTELAEAVKGVAQSVAVLRDQSSESKEVRGKYRKTMAGEANILKTALAELQSKVESVKGDMKTFSDVVTRSFEGGEAKHQALLEAIAALSCSSTQEKAGAEASSNTDRSSRKRRRSPYYHATPERRSRKYTSTRAAVSSSGFSRNYSPITYSNDENLYRPSSENKTSLRRALRKIEALRSKRHSSNNF